MLSPFIVLANAIVCILSVQCCNAWLSCKFDAKISTVRCGYNSHRRSPCVNSRALPFRMPITIYSVSVNDNDEKRSQFSEEENVDWEELSAELLSEDEDDGLNDDWLPDREKARLKKENYERNWAPKYNKNVTPDLNDAESEPFLSPTAPNSPMRPSPYTDEEEEIIAAMGGRSKRRGREPGFLGDSTLAEICTDYSVPISYLADVLCIWGVPIPIHVHDKLGDLVTGEQAFAILEAVNTLDVAALHDRYSNTNIQQLCFEWDIDLQQAFEMAMREGWSLPFGVQTCLRVEQERELLRVLGSQFGLLEFSDDDDDNEY